MVKYNQTFEKHILGLHYPRKKTTQTNKKNKKEQPRRNTNHERRRKNSTLKKKRLHFKKAYPKGIKKKKKLLETKNMIAEMKNFKWKRQF